MDRVGRGRESITELTGHADSPLGVISPIELQSYSVCSYRERLLLIFGWIGLCDGVIAKAQREVVVILDALEVDIRPQLVR